MTGTSTPRSFKRDLKNIYLPGLYRKADKSVVTNKKLIVNASVSPLNGRPKNNNAGINKKSNLKGSQDNFKKESVNKGKVYFYIRPK